MRRGDDDVPDHKANPMILMSRDRVPECKRRVDQQKRTHNRTKILGSLTTYMRILTAPTLGEASAEVEFDLCLHVLQCPLSS